MQDYSHSAPPNAGSGGGVPVPKTIEVFLSVLPGFNTVPHLAGNAKETVDILKESPGEVEPKFRRRRQDCRPRRRCWSRPL